MEAEKLDVDSGGPIAAPVCIVIQAAGGWVPRLFEYPDGAAVAPAFADPQGEMG